MVFQARPGSAAIIMAADPALQEARPIRSENAPVTREVEKKLSRSGEELHSSQTPANLSMWAKGNAASWAFTACVPAKESILWI